MTKLILTIAIIFACIFNNSFINGVSLQANRNTRQSKMTEILDGSGKFILSWEINEETKIITFEIEAQTLGYVGLGISPTGKMTGADIFIGGVRNGNEIYSGDYHATQNGAPILDDHNDWVLHEAKENNTHTYIRVSRLLNTCDDQDYPITEENTARVIWALGTTDTITYHATSRGTKSINLIHVPEPETDVTKLDKWDVFVNTTMPSADTTYWCTIHKGPALTQVHHVVGFEVFLENEKALKHGHHFIVSKCIPPVGVNASTIFEQFLTHPGEECYGQVRNLPSDYCRQYLFVWAVGGKRTLFPLNTGYPIDGSEQNAYYMLEAHYDNPEMLEGIQFTSGLRIFHSNQIRQYNAVMIAIGHDTVPSLIIPPNQTDFVISGHCAPDCSNLFPKSGLQVFNILLHSHLSGRKLKLRHFRNNVELPWLASDDSYDFDFQQNKPLRNEVVIMPGDHITYECTYDSTWNEGKVVLGGLSSREEMCLAFIWAYSTTGYPDINIDMCGATYDMHKAASEFGITSYSFQADNFTILEPAQYAGLQFHEYLNHNFTWTSEFIAELQQAHRYGGLEPVCCARAVGCGDFNDTISYPSISEAFVPNDPCSSNDQTNLVAHNILLSSFSIVLLIKTYLF